MDDPLNDISTTDTTTTMSDSSTQTPTFFHLPLELRHQIYNKLFHSDGTKTVYMEITLDPTSSLDPLTRLTAVSPTTTHQKSTNPLLLNPPFTSKRLCFVFTDMRLKPYVLALKISRTCTVGSGSYRDGNVAWVKDNNGYDKEISHQLRFWKLRVGVIGSSGRVRLIADIDFENQNVVIRDMHAVSLRFGGGSYDPLSFEEAFTKTVQAFS